MKRNPHFSWRLFGQSLLLFTIASLAATGVRAAITTVTCGPFDIDFYNTGDSFTIGTSSYTGTQDWTSERIADVCAGVGIWDTGIANTNARQIRMDLIWYGFDGATLGASSSPVSSNGTSAWNYGEGVWRDNWSDGLYSSSYDTRIVYDDNAAGYSWNFGNDAPASNQVDFRSVVTHEIGHSLGFSSTFNNDTGKFGSNGLSNWDTFLVDSSGNRAKKNSTGTPGDFNQLDNPIYFDGLNATMANGGSSVAIYAPDPYALGSSISHLDELLFSKSLMSPKINRWETIRAPSTVEWAMMKDIGWNIVPEPGAWAMLLGAAGTWFFWQRRRRPSDRY